MCSLGTPIDSVVFSWGVSAFGQAMRLPWGAAVALCVVLAASIALPVFIYRSVMEDGRQSARSEFEKLYNVRGIAFVWQRSLALFFLFFSSFHLWCGSQCGSAPHAPRSLAARLLRPPHSSPSFVSIAASLAVVCPPFPLTPEFAKSESMTQDVFFFILPLALALCQTACVTLLALARPTQCLALPVAVSPHSVPHPHRCFLSRCQGV